MSRLWDCFHTEVLAEGGLSGRIDCDRNVALPLERRVKLDLFGLPLGTLADGEVGAHLL